MLECEDAEPVGENKGGIPGMLSGRSPGKLSVGSPGKLSVGSPGRPGAGSELITTTEFAK